MEDILVDGLEFERLAGEILGSGHVLKFRVRGYSISPFIRDRDVVEIERCYQDFIKAGDIVLCYNAPAPLVLDRVCAVYEDDQAKMFVTQGDMLECVDGVIRSEQIQGRVTAVEHAGLKIKMDSVPGKIYAILWIRFSSLGRDLYLAAVRAKKLLGFTNDNERYKQRSNNNQSLFGHPRS